MKILVTGTPGVGKTTFSKNISSIFNIPHIDITEYIKDNNLYEEYNAELNTLEFEEEVVREHLKDYINNKSYDSFIIDTHSPSVADEFKFDFIFQLRCDLKELIERLEKRNYSERKIQENYECEIFDAVGGELEDYFEDEKIILVNGGTKEIEDIEFTTEDAVKIIEEKHNLIKNNKQ